MQKKLSIIFNIVLFISLTSATKSNAFLKEWSTTKKVGMLIGTFGLLAAGRYAENLNKDYAKKEKKPDLHMAGVKIISGATLLVGSDILLFGTNDTGSNLIKLGVFGVSLVAGSDTVAKVLKEVPCIGGLLTGPINKHGEEEKETGAAARILLTYVPLRKLALNFFGYETQKDKTTDTGNSNPF
jgi:hypothetical protein